MYIDGTSTGEATGNCYNPVQKALRTALFQLLEYKQCGERGTVQSPAEDLEKSDSRCLVTGAIDG